MKTAYNITYTQAGVSCFLGQESGKFKVQFPPQADSMVKSPVNVELRNVNFENKKMTDFTNEVPFDYWNKLANQVITISSLLGGFSIAIIANILVSQNDTRLVKIIMLVSTLAGSFFLVTIFAMTKLMLMTTEGYPFNVIGSDLTLPRIIGTISFFLGILSLIAMISLSGWTKSRKMGRISTGLGILTLILIMLMTT